MSSAHFETKLLAQVSFKVYINLFVLLGNNTDRCTFRWKGYFCVENVKLCAEFLCILMPVFPHDMLPVTKEKIMCKHKNKLFKFSLNIKL